MKSTLRTVALWLLFVAAPAFGGTMVTSTLTSYDIDSNHVKSFASFDYYRSMFEDTEYRYFMLQPWDYWTEETGLDSWSNASEVDAEAHECYYTDLAVQRLDAATGALLGNSADRSATVC